MQHSQSGRIADDPSHPARRRGPLHPADRQMLVEIRNSLNHLSDSRSRVGGLAMPDRADSVDRVPGQNGVTVERTPSTSSTGSGRGAPYKAKTLEQIRQSLDQHYAPPSNSMAATGNSNGLAGAGGGVGNMAGSSAAATTKTQMLMAKLGSMNNDKVWEMATADRLPYQPTPPMRNGSAPSRPLVNAASALKQAQQVLRKPSFEERFRTASPASSDLAGSSRSDSPSTVPSDSGPSNNYLPTAVELSDMYGQRVNAINELRPATARYVSGELKARPSGLANGRPYSGPPVTQRAVSARDEVYVAQSNSGVHVVAATALPTARPQYAIVPSDPLDSGILSPVSSVNSLAAAGYSRPMPVQAWNARQPAIVMQQVRSCEVSRPQPQKATAPSWLPHECAVLDDAAARFYHETVDYDVTMGTGGLIPTPIMRVPMTCDVQVSVASTQVARPLPVQAPAGDTLPEKPPPPYPGKTAPPPDNEQLSDDGQASGDEPQLIESPKPVRKADARRRDSENGQFKLRHFSPQAFRFYMEQHIENVQKLYDQRIKRRAQLEAEMSRCNLTEGTEHHIRRMLAQKESNYLRLRRAKIDRTMFEQIATLGTGAFGEVDLVRKRDTNVLFALKTLRKRDVLQRNQVAHVKAERDILAEADNEWVVRLYYSFQDAQNLYFVMDYIPGGDLMGLLIKKEVFTHELAQFYIAELVLAIESVHAMGFIHRDIKPDNILIDRDGHIRLTDFGLCTGFRWTHNSKYYQNQNGHLRQDSMEPVGGWSELPITGPLPTQQLTRRVLPWRRLANSRGIAQSLVGTPNYIAPEVLLRQGYTACCDWWSVGVILYEMRVGSPPFLASSAAETQRKVVNWQQALHIPRDAQLSPETENLILRLCCGPQERLGRAPGGAAELKQHPFFRDVNFAMLRQQRAPYIPPLRYATDTSNFDPVDPDSRLMRRSGSLDSLLETSDEVGRPSGGDRHHAFLEFTFRRFFDSEGHAHATCITNPDSDCDPVYV